MQEIQITSGHKCKYEVDDKGNYVFKVYLKDGNELVVATRDISHLDEVRFAIFKALLDFYRKG